MDLVRKTRSGKPIPNFVTVALAVVMPETLTLGAAVEDAFIVVNDAPPPPEVVASVTGKRIYLVWTESTGYERPADAVRAMLEDMATKPKFRELLRAPGIQAQKRALYLGTHSTTPAPAPAPAPAPVPVPAEVLDVGVWRGVVRRQEDATPCVSPAEPHAPLLSYNPTAQLESTIVELARAALGRPETVPPPMPADPPLDAPSMRAVPTPSPGQAASFLDLLFRAEDANESREDALGHRLWSDRLENP